MTSTKKRSNSLAVECERTLCASAREAAPRQQVRAAARAFVRRHRREDGYLRWVLRSVGASSALAVALLGLGAAPAGAELPPFAPQTGAANPLAGQDAGYQSAPSFGDLDADGDFDLVSGDRDGALITFRNTGSATGPAFVQLIGFADPLDGEDVGNNSAPAAGDLDGDGDLDLIVGERFGTFFYYENTGSATSPAFVLGATNPLAGEDVGLYSAPALGDLDADGDLDFVSGVVYGHFLYYENTGNAITPVFVARTGTANPLAGHNVGLRSKPALGDLDGDGDLDLVAGEEEGALYVFENTGSATSAVFVARTGAANPLAGQDVGFTSTPTVGDLDGDGDLGLVAGAYSGTFFTFESSSGFLVPRTGSANPLADQNVGGSPVSKPALGDLDGDGDLDLVAGEAFGAFFYFENTGGATTPAFIARTGAANPLAGQDVGYDSAPAFGDLDGDGDLDLISGENYGTFLYYENTGSATLPAFAARTGAANPLNGQDLGYLSAPALGDLDDDGDLDLVAGERFGAFFYYENTGSAAVPAFVLRPGAANPLAGQDVGDVSSPSLGDLDRDGDLDLLAGENSGVFNHFENTGSATSSAFVVATDPLAGQDVGDRSAPALGDLDGDGSLDVVSGRASGDFNYYESPGEPLSVFELTGPANPLTGRDVGSLAAPALVDLDRDGDADLVAGEDFGAFFYFENTGSAIGPAFLPRMGAANPLDGRDIGDGAKPAFADLDGDGDFDLLVGRAAGDFDYFENTGDAIIPLFAAAAANPFGLHGLSSDSAAPSFGDLDGDGDLDLVAGQYYGSFAYFENTGSRTSPAFALRTGAANPLLGFDPGSYSTPALGDFDGDADLDLVSGVTGGRLRFFQNTGSATNPVFVRLTGAANPLDGEDVGNNSSPAAGDLDGDGDLDLVTGNALGSFAVHYFPEPARALLLGAGVALLTWLERLRRRTRS